MAAPALMVRFERKWGTLWVQVAGESTLANTLSYWQAILDEILRERPPGGLLLVDELEGVPLSEGQWRELVAAMRGRGLEGLRIAHVKPRGLEKLEYCEMNAREAGLDARAFDHERAAEIWLRYGET